MKIKSTLLSFALIAAAGCGVGNFEPIGNDPDNPDITDPNDPPTTDPDYALTVVSPPQASLTLGNSAEFELTLTSQNFTGDVTLSATGVPDSWEVGFTPSNAFNLPLDDTVTVTMSVVVPTDAEALTSSIGVVAEAAPGPRESAVSVAVENRLVIDIADGTAGTAHPFPLAVAVRLGATVEFRDSDSTESHQIHADNAEVGFPHQESTMNLGDSYVVNINRAGTFMYYCHVHEVGAGVGNLEIVEPANPPAN